MRIAVTRLEEKAEGTRELFTRYGHEAVLAPTMKTAPADESKLLDDLCSKLEAREVEFLIFSSTMGVKCFFDLCTNIPMGIIVVAVGPQTANAIRKKGFECEIISSFSSDHFASHLGSRIKGKTVGIIRPDVPNPWLVSSLKSLGARVIEGVAYRLVPSGRDFKVALQDVDAVIFTSGKSFDLADVDANDLFDKIVVAIGPKTAGIMHQRGIMPNIVGNGTLKDCLKKI